MNSKLLWLLTLLRLVIGFVLIHASYDKLIYYDPWVAIVQNMGIVPDPSVRILAAILPGLEFILGLALLLGIWTRAAALLTTGLFAYFAGLMIWLMKAEVPVSCGCFGPDSDFPADGTHLLMNLALTAFSAVLLWRSKSAFELLR